MITTEKDMLIKRVDEALEDIRPHLAVDGGNIEVISITDDYNVVIKWLGTCEFCSMSAMTMKAGVEQAVKSKVPEIKGIEAINGLHIA
ncbi:MAG TPA: NifU family protein [Saprospiraceae bacterium]|nr:NifU family protein [Saprospiraceae bacterium]